MLRITQGSGVALSQQPVDGGLDWDSWSPVYNFEGGWTGKILIQCSAKQDILRLHQYVRNKGIDAQGHSTTLSLSTDYFDLPESS